MKIPTLFALPLLIVAIVLGVAVFIIYQQRLAVGKVVAEPKQTQVVNITSNSVSITWQTDAPTMGSIIYGSSNIPLNKEQKDDRDTKKAQSHIVHFVTIRDLNPETKYFFKIKDSNFTYPEQPLEFKTAKAQGSNPSILNLPIRGTVLDSELRPIDEALVLLKINGASTLATFTATAGNFILPLTDIRSSDLSTYFSLDGKKEATLEIDRLGQKATIKLMVPPDNISLPPIELGKSLDLKDIIASPSAQTPVTPSAPISQNKYDLNGDGRVNSVDLSIIVDNLGSNPKDRRTDVNGDGTVDQKDLDDVGRSLQ